MIIDSLKLTNVRAIENAEFQFQPGFNLIIGGKWRRQNHCSGCVTYLSIPNSSMLAKTSHQGDFF